MADEQIAAAGAAGMADSAVFLPVDVNDLAARVALAPHEVAEILSRLQQARLVMTAQEAGIQAAEKGFVIPEVGRLLEFLEFLELRERYGQF
jgi:hypothetical protein